MYYKDFLRYRQVWLGIALLWVIAYHYPLYLIPFDLGAFRFFKEMGYGGVDICIFASGIGCFFSLSSDSDAGRFLKRRIKRLIPMYIMVMVIWLAYRYIVGKFGLQMALGNLLAVQSFTGLKNDFNWYIGAIFLCYILAPYFKATINRFGFAKRLSVLTFLLVCSIPFWGSDTLILMITRLPLFLFGYDVCGYM